MTSLPIDAEGSDSERKAVLNLKPDDLGTAFRLHYRQLFYSPKNLIISLLIFLSVSAIAVLPGSDQIGLTVFLFAGFLILQFSTFAIVSIGFAYFAANHLGRRSFLQQKNLHETMLINWDDSGLQTKSNSMSTFTPWVNYLKFVENDRIVLLYQSDLLFQFLPKRFLSSTQIADLRRFSARFASVVSPP